MSERLRSIGLDVGTTSFQMILSELVVENRASQFAVPEMEIGERRILYRSPVYFTPLLSESLVDGDALRKLVTVEYEKAGITRQQVDTGAIIITGETSRRENAKTVLQALSDFAGDFVVATAGPDLESVLAAKGAGACAYSSETGKTVLHMDIGGGTSNLALIRDGKIVRTGCLNVGGRLIKLEENGKISYISPVLSGICPFKTGETVTREQLAALTGILARALEMAAGLRQRDVLLDQLMTAEADHFWNPPGERVTLSFSGGVAACMQQQYLWMEFGDLGPLLAEAILNSRLCSGDYVLGQETIRATVIGAGCHSAQLSGSTVFHKNISFPLKNVPTVPFPGGSSDEETVIFTLPGIASPTYQEVVSLAGQLMATGRKQLLICLEQDMAKALGQALAVRMPPDAEVLCIDRVKVGEGSYVDIGAPVSCTLPVVVKTLVLGR